MWDCPVHTIPNLAICESYQKWQNFNKSNYLHMIKAAVLIFDTVLGVKVGIVKGNVIEQGRSE